ncbi:MAG: exodeoxyribonuclease VII small subunit [Candidatus Obscuribacterales bacterium]|nr:exodeoxyribonuclease VII small subunit [Candidatus Obscuribacterales bacterium]
MDKTKDFESTLLELEDVVQKLDGEVKLELALELFERGMKLSRQCEEFLKGAEQKVEILKKNLDGTISASPLDNDEEDDDHETGAEADAKPARSAKPASARGKMAAKSSSNQLSLPLD